MSELVTTTAHPVSRDTVFAAEQKLLALPQVPMQLVHHFAPGIYARELHIPADTILTGAIHKQQNMNVLSQGEIMVLVDGEMRHVKAPFTVVSPAGIKRIAYAVTDCVWTTFFQTDETDPEKIVAEFTTNDEQEYLALNKNLTLEGE